MKFSKISVLLAIIATFGLIVLCFTSCSTIINGTTQDIGVASNQEGAEIFVNGMNMGRTPNTITLERGKQHLIEIKKSGYETYKLTTSKTIAGWFFGNLLCGGIIGMVIDLVNGAAYEIEPDSINAQLTKNTALLGNYNHDDFSQIFIKDKSGKLIDSFVIAWK